MPMFAVFFFLVSAISQGQVHYGKSLAVADTVIEIDDRARDHIAGEGLLAVVMQAGSEPVFHQGELVGFKLLDIDEGSIFQLAGFRNGDIVTHILGTPLKGADAALKLLTRVKTLDAWDYTVQRGGKTLTYHVRVH